MKSKKTLSILVIVMVLSAIMVPTLVFAGPVDGYITIASNTAPEITAFSVTGTPFDPTAASSVSITVSDADYLSNISEILVVFWYTTSAGNPLALPDTSTNIKSNYGDSQTVHWVDVFDGGSTFEYDDTNTLWVTSLTSTLPASPGTTTSDTFTFDVTPGAEAQEVVSATDTDKWVVAALVTDADSNTDFAVATGSIDTPISMTWYGEIGTTGMPGPWWTGAYQGMTYGDTGSGAQVFNGTDTLTVISNGAYSFEVYADNDWTNGTDTLTYDVAVDGTDEFSLAVDTSATYNGTGQAQILPNDTLTSGHTDTITLTKPADSSWGTTGTDNLGVGITNIYLYLQTSSTVALSGSNGNYTGQVTFTVVND